MKNEWNKATEWEKGWWGNCINTYGEETKQFIYAQKMGLVLAPTIKTPYCFNLQNKSVLDIGGGPVSILLKCENVKGVVIDPINFPKWVWDRYEATGINFACMKGEDIPEQERFDEVWIYNVLQHTENPEKIINNSRRIGKIIRLFEWIDNGISEGHIHNLTELKLNKWLEGEGKIEMLNENECNGKGYYGVFLGK